LKVARYHRNHWHGMSEISTYLKSNINRTKKLIYDREGEKFFV